MTTLNRLDVSEVKTLSFQGSVKDEESDFPKENITEIIQNDFSYEDFYLPTLISSEGLSLIVKSKCKCYILIG